MDGTVVTGVDLVYLPRFRKALASGGASFLQRVFLESELTGKVSRVSKGENVTYLAGIFAAKEAVIKALGLPVDSFHDIKVAHRPTGAPVVEITSYKLPITNYSLSISHDGKYAIAQFVALVKT